MKKLTRKFYSRPTLEVAKDLLGKYVVHKIDKVEYMAKIVEVEAYIGDIDKACHAYKNKVTPRTKTLYSRPGTAYVYIIYGMYHCLNTVTETEGRASGVLIRAGEPVKGMDRMARNRFNKSLEEINKRQVHNLTSGPGKLTMAMNITRDRNNIDLCGDELYLMEGEEKEDFEIVTTTRVNIDYAEEAVDFPWRFYIKDNPYVSKK